MHISYESGILENVGKGANEDIFEMTTSPMKAPDKETKLVIEFKKGVPVKVVDKTNKVSETDPLKLFIYLNKIGGENGVGRVDLVENRFVGMKSRGVYETPGGTILMNAHLDIEGITMDKEVKQIQDTLIPKISALIYNGFWYSPEFELLMTMVDKSQENVTGSVNLKLYKGNVIVTGRSSSCSLYDEKIASMDKHGGYDQKDAKGFIKLNALRLKKLI